MYISLCDDSFYPLVNRRAKWMSYEDKLTYRVKHGIPRTIDDWIDEGRMHSKAPTANPHERGPSGRYPLWQDDVECILNVTRKETITEGDANRAPDEFTLTLRIRVPSTTVYLMHYWQSPTVIVDRYTGDPDEKLSPKWLQIVDTECRFWQSRTLMLEMMLYFVRNIVHNSRVSRRAQDWCSAMSIPVSSLLTWVYPWRFDDPMSPRNKRSHKPQASQLSFEESQNLRMTLNMGSPLRGKK